MNVAELQQFLNQLLPVMKTAGMTDAKLNELRSAVECFEPFRDKKVSDFASFLRATVEHYTRAGTFPEIAKSGGKVRAPRTTPITVAQAAQKFMSLYERAPDGTLDYSTVDAEIDAFKSLKKEGLKQLASEINLDLPKKITIPEILAEMKRKVKERKENRDRNKGPVEPLQTA